MSQCECVAAGEPRDIIDLHTPLYQALGGRLYRLHVTTDASAVLMGDGVSVETRLLGLERSLLTNTTTYFADTIAHRDKVAPLTAGDRCYVFDASADPTVPYGSAMYIWLPSRQWRKLYNGDSPIEAQNMIVPGGGLGVEDNRLYVKGADIIVPGKGLAAEDDRLFIRMADLVLASKGLATDANGRLYVNLADLVSTGAGLATGSDGKLKLDMSKLPAADLGAIAGSLASAGGGLTTGSDGMLKVDAAALAGTGLASGADGRLKVNSSALAGDGLSAGSDGKLNVDLSALSKAQLRALALELIQSGGGIGVDSQGRLYVDYSTMPDTRMQAVLETFRKGLRLPRWLTASTSFYVDKSHAQASDTLDEGRGLSAAKPFKTITACLNHISEDYNLGKFNATVLVGAGDYTSEGRLNLPSYSASTGVLTIRNVNNNASQTITGPVSLANSVTCNVFSITAKGYNISSGAVGCFESSAGILQLRNVIADLSALSAAGSASGGFSALYSHNGGNIRVYAYNDNDYASGISIRNSGDYEPTGLITCSDKSEIRFAADVNILSDLSFGNFVAVSTGGLVNFTQSAYVNPGRYPVFNLASHTCAGRRYSVGALSQLATSQDENFIPGSTAGVVNAIGRYGL